MVSVYSHLDFGVLRRVTSMYFHTDTIEIFGRRNAAGESNSRTDRIVLCLNCEL
jgi:hypothetical protein